MLNEFGTLRAANSTLTGAWRSRPVVCLCMCVHIYRALHVYLNSRNNFPEAFPPTAVPDQSSPLVRERVNIFTIEPYIYSRSFPRRARCCSK